MIEILELIKSNSVIGGLIGGLMTGLLAFSGGVMQRSQDRKLRRYDRGFELKLDRYDAYSKSVTEVLRAITRMHEEATSEDFGSHQSDDVPQSVLDAYYNFQVVAPLDVRNHALDQFGVMQDAMAGDVSSLKSLNSMHNDLILILQYDLGISDEGVVVRQILRVRRWLWRRKSEANAKKNQLADQIVSERTYRDVSEVSCSVKSINQKT